MHVETGTMPSARVIAIVNQKGGAGKSTTAANLAVALSGPPLSRRVLALDGTPVPLFEVLPLDVRACGSVAQRRVRVDVCGSASMQQHQS